MWLAWGMRPEAMIGHSIGEYVAAHLAGVMSLDDALRIVAARGRLMGSLPRGSMLSLSLSEEQARDLLASHPALSLAAINAPGMVVVAGPDAAMTGLEAELEAKGVAARRLRTSHAFHSPMMDPILAAFADVVRGVAPATRRPFPISQTSAATWITERKRHDPEYYARHLRSAVRFAAGIATLAAEPSTVFVWKWDRAARWRASYGRTRRRAASALVVTSLRHPNDTADDLEFALARSGSCGSAGIVPDWDPQEERRRTALARVLRRPERRRRIPLPLYPFQRERYWVEPDAGWGPAVTRPQVAVKTPDTGRWFYAPSWQRIPAAAPPAATVARAHAGTPGGFLVFATGSDLDAALLAQPCAVGAGAAPGGRAGQRLRGHRGGVHRPAGAGRRLRPRRRRIARSKRRLPETVVHLWSACPGCDFETAQTRGFDSLFALAQGVVTAGGPP